MKKKILFTLLTILLSPSLWAQEDLHWQCDPHAYKFDMTANVVLQVSGTTLTDYANYEVAAFHNDECRGVADFQKVGATDTQVGYLRIYFKENEAGEKVTFKAYDKARQKEMIIPDAELTFAEDETHGQPSNPLKLVAYYLYTVTTSVNGNGSVSEGAVVRSDGSIKLTATADENHHFVNWTSDGGVEVSKVANFTFTPTDDAALTANFAADQYRVRFVVDGADVVNKLQDFGSAIEAPANPTKVGYTFTGWSPEVDATVPAKDVTYTALWKANKYQITFQWDGGSETSQQEYGADLKVPAPQRAGYELTGWEPALPKVVPASDQTYTAQWSAIAYTITCDLNGGTVAEANPGSYTVESAAITLNNPTRDGYQFAGWTSEDFVGTSMAVTIPLGSTGNRTYTATWTMDSYSITYYLDGGKWADGVSNPTAYSFESEAITLNKPVREGYTFKGWTGTDLTDATEVVTIAKGSSGDRSYTATWQINQWTVKFIDRREGFDDVDLKSEVLDFGAQITFPENPSWVGHEFIAWKAVKAPGEGGTMPDYDLTYVSTWDALTLSLSYQLDGKPYGEATTVTYGADIEVKPEPASNNGYTFSGWKGFPETGKMPAYDLIIKGEYIPIDYTISYELAEGTLEAGVANPTTYTVETSDIILKNPSRTGYTFAGWTGTGLDEAAVNVTIFKGSIGNRTYTATWTANEYTMTFVLGKGEDNVVQTLAYTSELTAPTPIRTGYTFNGWKPEVPATVPAGDQTFTAQWTIDSYQLQFIVDGAAVYSSTVPFEDAISAPADPTKTGYTFAGWGAEVPDKMPAQDLTFTAQWNINQYTITFDTDGGSEVDAITQDYATAVTAPAAPTKEGYTFTGWDQEIPATMPAENVTVKAQWNINQYTITFDTDGGTEVDAIKQDYATAITAPADPTKEGYTFDGWDKEIPATMPAGNMTIKAQWNINQYTITFDTDGGTAIDAITQDYATAITKPADPTKEGHIFLRWDQEIPATMPAGNVTVKAQWLISQYTITFDTDGGTAVAPITQNFGTAITAPAAPTKTGYTFAGWDKVIPATMPAENVTIKAQWTINQYTITFDTDGGSAVDAITQDYGTTITAPAAPTKIGYIFDGWQPALPETMPAEDMTLKAKWASILHTITFDTDGGSEVAAITQGYGTAVTAPAAPTKEGYTFAGWDQEIPATMPDKDMTIKAQWTINRYTITFDTDGGSAIAAITQDYATTITAPAAPTKTGYTFVGWQPALPETMPAGNTTVKAQWIANRYTITFDTDGGTAIASITQSYATPITAPADPTKEGYTFIGWDKEIPATMPAGNMTIKAQWIINQYTITFDADGGSEVAAITQDYATAITSPADPTKEGYTFAGWQPALPETMPAGNMTLKAQWTINQYTITFDADGGSEVAAITQDYATTITAPADPVKTGYTFGGWQPALPETMPAENMTIKALWTANTYKVIYQVDGQEYKTLYVNYGEAIVPEPAPQKDQRAFSGWSEIPATMPADSVVISGGFAYVISYYDEEDVLYATDTLFYGEEIVKPDYTPKDPERFTFLGWQGEEVDTMPDHDLVFKAKLNDGITGIVADEDDSAIYSVNGAKLRNHATPKDIRSLPRGTYIIRGKKVLIR